MTLVRIVVLTILTHTAFGAARLTGSLYALSNNASAFTVGVMMALFALVPMLLAVRAGRWLDAVGPRRPLLLGASLMTLGIALPVAFPYHVADVAPLLVGAALIGTGFLYLQLTVQQLVGEQTAPERRAAAFSYVALGFSTSGLIAPVTSGFLIDTYGHRVTFAVFFGVMLVALATLVVQRGRLAHRDVRPAADNERDFFDLFRHKSVRDVLIASGMISMAWDLQTFMIPVYGTRIGLTASQIGLVLGSFAAATFAIRLAMPAIARSVSEWQVLTFTLFTSALAFLAIPFLDAMLPLMICTFVLGLGLGSAQPNVMSLLHSRTPAGRVGEALGLRTTIMNSSHVVLPLVFGAFGSVLGAGVVFWLMGLTLGVGGVRAYRHQSDERGPP
jgi:predicted MFS family arabinose efflux permease